MLKTYNPCFITLHFPGRCRKHINCLFSQMSNWKVERRRNLEEEGLLDRLNCCGLLMLDHNCLHYILSWKLSWLACWMREKKMTLVVQHFINIYILFMGSGDILNKVSIWNSISSTKKSKNSLVSCAFSFSFSSNNPEVQLQSIWKYIHGLMSLKENKHIKENASKGSCLLCCLGNFTSE